MNLYQLSKKKRRKRKVCKLVSVVGIILYCFVNHAYENSLLKNKIFICTFIIKKILCVSHIYFKTCDL